ncbi:hypothetical protein [Streptomyces sp. NPDC060031]|uniref:hypothetical protein n=1 Tax=Streptomyces sp. NPDC060031 TaxID=3347043 RepID=UPI0036BADAC6
MACKSKPAGPPPPCSTGGPVTDTTSTMPLAVKPGSVRSLLSDAQFNDVMHTVLDNNPGMEPGLAAMWIDPGYADVVEAMRAVRYAQTPDRQGPAVVRGFVVAEPDES